MTAPNFTAFSEGIRARGDDDESGETTENPYRYGSHSHQMWNQGYDYEPDFTDVERNHLCPCMSGKKYKNCHMKKGEQ